MKTRPWVPMDEGRTWTRTMPGYIHLEVSEEYRHERYTGRYVYRVTDFWNYLIDEGARCTLVEAVKACCAVAHVYAAPIVRVGGR